MTTQIHADVKPLTESDLDAVTGGVIKWSFTLFGSRWVFGTDQAGVDYLCVNSATSGICVRGE